MDQQLTHRAHWLSVGTGVARACVRFDRSDLEVNLGLGSTSMRRGRRPPNGEIGRAGRSSVLHVRVEAGLVQGGQGGGTGHRVHQGHHPGLSLDPHGHVGVAVGADVGAGNKAGLVFGRAEVGNLSGHDNVQVFDHIFQDLNGFVNLHASESTAIDIDQLVSHLESAIPTEGRRRKM